MSSNCQLKKTPLVIIERQRAGFREEKTISSLHLVPHTKRGWKLVRAIIPKCSCESCARRAYQASVAAKQEAHVRRLINFGDAT